MEGSIRELPGSCRYVYLFEAAPKAGGETAEFTHDQSAQLQPHSKFGQPRGSESSLTKASSPVW